MLLLRLFLIRPAVVKCFAVRAPARGRSVTCRAAIGHVYEFLQGYKQLLHAYSRSKVRERKGLSIITSRPSCRPALAYFRRGKAAFGQPEGQNSAIPAADERSLRAMVRTELQWDGWQRFRPSVASKSYRLAARNWSHAGLDTNGVPYELGPPGEILNVNAGAVPERPRAAVCPFNLPCLCPPRFTYFQQLKML
jgi:hypothetical protein